MAAADPKGALPPDLSAWRRLALKVLIQAARDADGRGYPPEVDDTRGAKKFFYSRRFVWVYERHLWFGMAGLEEPPLREMERLVSRLMAYGTSEEKRERR